MLHSPCTGENDEQAAPQDVPYSPRRRYLLLDVRDCRVVRHGRNVALAIHSDRVSNVVTARKSLRLSDENLFRGARL